MPMVHIIPSQDLARASAKVGVVRPPKTKAEHDHGHHDMHPEINTILFTDSNHPSKMTTIFPGFISAMNSVGAERSTIEELKLYTVAPLWGNFFDYYQLHNTENPITAARTIVPVEHVSSDSGSQLNVKVLCTRSDWVTMDYKEFGVKKMPGQGDWDNLHHAPLMKYPDAVRALNASRFTNPPVGGQTPQAEWGTREISMAPFCVHDCLHMHWRWGAELSSGQKSWRQWGWDGFDPFVKAGYPIVPSNQRIEVAIPAAGHSHVQTITMFRPEAGRWQIANHNGMAFAVYLPEEVEKIKYLLDLYLVEVENESDNLKLNADDDYTGESWPVRYWRFRYGGTKTTPYERLRFTKAEMEAFRDYRARSDWGSKNK